MSPKKLLYNDAPVLHIKQNERVLKHLISYQIYFVQAFISLVSIADRTSRLCGVSSHYMRRIEPVGAGKGAHLLHKYSRGYA
jgi:hypothetical protein